MPAEEGVAHLAAALGLHRTSATAGNEAIAGPELSVLHNPLPKNPLRKPIAEEPIV